MSVNTAHASGGVLIYNGEIILLYCDGVELSIENINAKELSGTKKGRIYLTTHRMIFLNKSEKDPLQSFSFPFFSLGNVELEQPIFGANFIKGNVNAQAGGNFSGKASFKLKFFSGGAIEFGQAMLRAAQMANQYMPPAPPPYTPHQGPYYPAPPPAYMAPSGGINGFVPPTHMFPDSPPPNSVYTTDMPPPYPGIYPYSTPYYQPQGPQPAQNGYPPQGMANGYPGGPPPPGFAPTPGTYAMAPPGGAYPPPPPYNPAHTQGATGQFIGTAQEPPSSESKGSAPMYDFYYQPQNPGTLYGPAGLVNGDPPNTQGPPPPYSEQTKKQQ